MKFVALLLLIASSSAFGKGTGQYYSNIEVRNVARLHCLVIGTYTDKTGTQRRAFLTSQDLCASDTARQLAAYLNRTGTEVFFNSTYDTPSADAQNLIFRRTGISEVEIKSAIDLAAEMQDYVTKTARRCSN